MIGIVIVTHGRLAQETIVAMEHMVGSQPNLRAVSIGPEDDIERRCREVGAAVKSVDRGQGVVVATDMYGGTPCNIALTSLARGRVEVLAGYSLTLGGTNADASIGAISVGTDWRASSVLAGGKAGVDTFIGTADDAKVPHRDLLNAHVARHAHTFKHT